MPTLFLYGTSLPGQPEHRWITGLPLSPATVRGALWRGPRNRPVLVPGDGRPIKGVIVEVDPARLAVMDLVETGGEGPLRRVPVRASVNMRSVPAEAWAWPGPGRLPRGWRRLMTDDWSRIAR